ncbi:hypothetical protein INT43_006395 [Umbelopsis isabellina]|uniref:Uncharacterized protein n=1 Tax=Mortierella isabellina TaxID=91625 RepID=A0A8H7PZ49_MORIS|nr:hypothetical protein INT43_006395 [Umbelopsis isabellina]
MPTITPLISKALTSTAYDVKWIPQSARLCTIGASNRGAGVVSVYKMEGKQLVLVNETESGSTFRCGTFGAASGHERHLATGNFDGKLQLWDPERLELPITSTKGHDSIINAIDGYGPLNCGSQSSALLTGGRDGRIKLWDVRAELSPMTVVSPENQSADIWSVSFDSKISGRLFATGYDNGDIKIFDHRSSGYIWGVNVGSGVCSLDFKSTESEKLLIAGTLSGYHIINLDTGAISDAKLNTTIWKVMSVPAQPNFYMTASGEGHLSLYKHGSLSTPVTKSKQTEHPIVSFDWNTSKQGLFAAVSFDQQVRIGLVNL